MRWKEQFAETRRRFDMLSFYEKFEHVVIFILTVLIALFVVFAVWNLALKLFQSIASSSLDPTDYTVFQSVFGAILTVIIALEFKRSLLVSTERQQSVVQVRTVILIALLAALLPLNRETLYGGGEQGYTDYPILRAVAPHACYRDAERAWG